MNKQVKKALEKFVKASPSAKILFMFATALILAALAYAVFVLLIAK